MPRTHGNPSSYYYCRNGECRECQCGWSPGFADICGECGHKHKACDECRSGHATKRRLDYHAKDAERGPDKRTRAYRQTVGRSRYRPASEVKMRQAVAEDVGGYYLIPFSCECEARWQMVCKPGIVSSECPGCGEFTRENLTLSDIQAAGIPRLTGSELQAALIAFESQLN